MSAESLRSLLVTLPKLMTRKDVQKHFGSLYSTAYLANLDSQKKGPKWSRIGRKVVYESTDFIEWLIARQSNV